MKAVVVYESHWGNTATIARAIAAGFGSGTRALSTAEAVGPAIEGVDLLIVGAPVLGFTVPNQNALEGVRKSPGAPIPPDLSHPAMRTWLDTVPAGKGLAAAFETRISWSPGGSAPGILRALAKRGYKAIDKGQRFIVTGKYGPLKPGEIERAHAWGAELALGLER